MLAKKYIPTIEEAQLQFLKNMVIPKGEKNCLSGLTFVITGTLPALKRKDAEILIKKYGGKVGSSVTDKTDYVIKGCDQEKSKKLEESKKRGIKIIDQVEFFDLIRKSRKFIRHQINLHPKIPQFPKCSTIPQITEYIDNNQKLQANILNFLDNSENNEENYQLIIQIIDNQKIGENKNELTSLFHLITKISNNHYRFPYFFEKIQKILLNLKDSMIKNYTNYEIFHIFKSNKRLLLFLMEEKILKIDEKIVAFISNKLSFKNMSFKHYKIKIDDKYKDYNYFEYFAPEIKPFLQDLEVNIPENFNELRKLGENENPICELIRKDSIKDFLIYINKYGISVNDKIKQSIFETNNFLIKKQINKQKNHYNGQKEKAGISLIDYSMFFGAIQIFNYLISNDAELTPSSWLFAIHGQNPEILHVLEDKKIEHNISILKESIKCHHNDVVNYYINNLTNDGNYINEMLIESLKSYNYMFINSDLIGQTSFYFLCKYDYYSFVELLLKNGKIDINNKVLLRKDIKVGDDDDDNSNNNDDDNSNNKNDYYDLKDCDFNLDENSSLSISLQKENIEICKLLLRQEQIDINMVFERTIFRKRDFMERETDYRTIFHMAVEQENYEIIKLLLQHKDIDINKEYILIYSMYCENDDISDVIDKMDEDFTENWPPNYCDGGWFIGNSNYDPDKGCDPSARIQKVKMTPLFKAVHDKNIEMIKLLTSIDSIDVNIKGQLFHLTVFGSGNYTHGFEKSPLYEAILNGNIEIVKLLLENNNVDCNTLNIDYELGEGGCFKNEKTPLFAAVENKNIDIIKLLLDSKNINLNMKSKLAKIGGDDAEEFVRDIEYKTPLKLAIENNNDDIIELLDKK